MAAGRRGIPVMVFRGGTSKGAYFLAADLPAGGAERDEVLLAVMGSPDPRQIDGIGGAHPLTSKVAVVTPVADGAVDVDYLFLQVQVDTPVVGAAQPCGNVLAGVGPFAIERGLVAPAGPVTPVRVRIVNTGSVAVVHVPTPEGQVDYGDTGARLLIDFRDTAGSMTPALLPTGNVIDVVDGMAATLIDNGMPVVVVDAASLGVHGHEAPAELESDAGLGQRVERLRLEAGHRMGLGDVTATTVPKVCLVSDPTRGGSLATRMFVPHRVHPSIGVRAAVSVGTAAALAGSVATRRSRPATDPAVLPGVVRLEHPTGWFDAFIEVTVSGGDVRIERSAIVSTARLLFDGTAFARSR